jgi:hypothetical protein
LGGFPPKGASHTGCERMMILNVAPEQADFGLFGK